MKKLLAVIFLFWGLTTFSQSSSYGVKSWQMGWLLTNAIPTSDGGQLIVGGYDSLTLLKIDANNNQIWAKAIYNGIGFLKIKLIEKNSNYYMYYQVPGGGSANLYIMKFSNAGQILFSKTIFCGNVNWVLNDQKADFSVNNLDEVIMNSSLDGFMTIHKIDNAGNLIYGYKINADTLNDNNTGYGSVITNDGGTILTGKSDTGAVIVKLNQSGTLQWAKTYNVSDFNDCRPQKIIKSINGGYLMSGYCLDFMNGGQVPFLMKIDSIGNLIWYNEYSNGNFNDHSFTDIAELPNNNIVAYFDNTAMLIETNSTGNILAKKRIGSGCDNVHSYLNKIYIDNYEKITIISNSISNMNCLLSDTLNFDLIRTVTSNSIVSVAYAKIESYGALYTYTVPLGNTKATIEQVCSMVGIEEDGISSNIKIFPNPATSLLNIVDEQDELQNSTIEISNSIGQIVLATKFYNRIDISELQSGMYFLTISNNSIRKTVKIVKQ